MNFLSNKDKGGGRGGGNNFSQRNRPLIGTCKHCTDSFFCIYIKNEYVNFSPKNTGQKQKKKGEKKFDNEKFL